MNAIIAHFDGKVFVPDEPVVFEPGAAVIVTRTEPSLPPSNTDFLRPVLFPLDHEASQKFIDDPETNLENYWPIPLDIPDGSLSFVDTNILVYHFVEHPKFSEECRGFLQRVVAGKVSVVSVASVVADAVHKVMAEEARIQHNLATGAVRFLQHHPAEIAQLNAFVDAAKQLERLPIRLLPVDLSTIRQAAGLA